jgi:hypothetical protein
MKLKMILGVAALDGMTIGYGIALRQWGVVLSGVLLVLAMVVLLPKWGHYTPTRHKDKGSTHAGSPHRVYQHPA